MDIIFHNLNLTLPMVCVYLVRIKIILLRIDMVYISAYTCMLQISYLSFRILFTPFFQSLYLKDLQLRSYETAA